MVNRLSLSLGNGPCPFSRSARGPVQETAGDVPVEGAVLQNIVRNGLR